MQEPVGERPCSGAHGRWCLAPTSAGAVRPVSAVQAFSSLVHWVLSGAGIRAGDRGLVASRLPPLSTSAPRLLVPHPLVPHPQTHTPGLCVPAHHLRLFFFPTKWKTKLFAHVTPTGKMPLTPCLFKGSLPACSKDPGTGVSPPLCLSSVHWPNRPLRATTGVSQGPGSAGFQMAALLSGCH